MSTEQPNEMVQFRDFGQMHVNKRKVPQSQANLYSSLLTATSGDNIARQVNAEVVKIIKQSDPKRKRALSRFIVQVSGMYSRAVRYLSDIYRFDYILYPATDLTDLATEEGEDSKVNTPLLKKFSLLLDYFDRSAIKSMAKQWAYSVCVDGCYYGYLADDVNDKLVIHDLPIDYCRSRFYHRGRPAVEFNIKFFEDVSRNKEVREQIAALFPKEIQAAYKKVLSGALKSEEAGKKDIWILLDLNSAFKFSLGKDDIPPLLHAIPAILQLGEIQDLTKEKLLQGIQKILVQKIKLNEHNQLPFSMGEIRQLNANAAEMIGDTVGVSVLTTVAEVEVHDLNKNTTADSQEQVKNAENAVYNDFGISSNLFNTAGNLSLEKSIALDEALVNSLLLQFEEFFNEIIEAKFNKKNLKFRIKVLETTIFNYKELSDKYRDLTKIGFSRFLPMAALGHSQKEVISSALFEQKILQLDRWMLPPFSSNTMSAEAMKRMKDGEDLAKITKSPVAELDDKPVGETKTGRPSLPEDQKSDKTIANQASM